MSDNFEDDDDDFEVVDDEEVKFSLEVMINKEKSKVLFVEADNHFTDILLSFLTLPLGRIAKLLEKHYGEEAPTIGSLNTLYHSLADLDSSHFCTEGAKLILLNPTSSFEADYQRLKLDIFDFQPAKYFSCSNCGRSFRSVSMYYDWRTRYCGHCSQYSLLKKVVAKSKKWSLAAASDGVFTTRSTSFIISDDLKILPNVTGLLGIITILGITDVDKAEPINVTFGFTEIMNLLKASLISQTPFSHIVLNKARQMNDSVVVESEPETYLHHTERQENPKSKKMILKVAVHKPTGKLLYAQAEEDFVQFLFSFLNIPLGGVERLVSGMTCIKTINNLYRSTADLLDTKYFKTPSMKNRLIKLNLHHGCISENHTLPLTEECLPASYCDLRQFTCRNFPNGKGNFLKGRRTYKVADDLTVTPFCIVAILSSLNEMKIPISDVKELELQIGLEEGLSILKASLTSTSALNDGLMNRISEQSPNEFDHIQ